MEKLFYSEVVLLIRESEFTMISIKVFLWVRCVDSQFVFRFGSVVENVINKVTHGYVSHFFL